jgi:hypothetical protein
MVRGRPRKNKEQVSINGEAIAVMEKPMEALDSKDQRIADLEKKIAYFEERQSQKPYLVPDEPKAPFQPIKKEPELPIPLITQVTSRDMFEVEDRKPVYGTFRMQNKKPGEKGMIRIGAMRKYKGDKMTPWIFEHGKNYTIPKWLADWINGGEKDPEAKVKTPRCNIVTHNDQNNDLQNKRMLAAPNLHPLFSFTPVAKW